MTSKPPTKNVFNPKAASKLGEKQLNNNPSLAMINSAKFVSASHWQIRILRNSSFNSYYGSQSKFHRN